MPQLTERSKHSSLVEQDSFKQKLNEQKLNEQELNEQKPNEQEPVQPVRFSSVSVHHMMVPGRQVNALLPGAVVDEIVDDKKVRREQAGAQWFVGFIDWQGLSVPIVSFEAMLSAELGAELADSKNKEQRVLVLKPLPERGEASRLALLSDGIPTSIIIDDNAAVEMELPSGLDERFIAKGVKVNDRLAVIPDFDVLLGVFPTL